MSQTLNTPFPSSLIPASQGRPANDPIFALDAEARARAAAGEEIVNATLGALMEDDGSLSILPAVYDALRGVDPRRAAAYAPIAGDEAFRVAVIRDVFGDEALASGRYTAVATPGGTGAIHHAVLNFLEAGQALYTGSFFWGPYKTIAQHSGRGLETFEMFDESGAFHMEAFEQGLRSLLTQQDRILVVLNFPCNNPTGYSLDEGEWRRVASILRELGSQAPVTLLVDLAYAKYGTPESHRWVEWTSELRETCTLLVAWTASKSFAQYGSRVGALVARPRDGEATADITNALAFSCRATWSNCNHLGILAITHLLQDVELRQRVDEERGRLTRLLGDRVELFNSLARERGLRYPRYEGGFFVTVFTPHPKEVAQRAREAGVFVVPVQGAVRVALCSTPSSLVPRLVDGVAEAIDHSGRS